MFIGSWSCKNFLLWIRLKEKTVNNFLYKSRLYIIIEHRLQRHSLVIILLYRIQSLNIMNWVSFTYKRSWMDVCGLISAKRILFFKNEASMLMRCASNMFFLSNTAKHFINANTINFNKRKINKFWYDRVKNRSRKKKRKILSVNIKYRFHLNRSYHYAEINL